jgi:hypothetical protein
LAALERVAETIATALPEDALAALATCRFCDERRCIDCPMEVFGLLEPPAVRPPRRETAFRSEHIQLKKRLQMTTLTNQNRLQIAAGTFSTSVLTGSSITFDVYQAGGVQVAVQQGLDLILAEPQDKTARLQEGETTRKRLKARLATAEKKYRHLEIMSATGVRRGKAALFQWVQGPPGNRSSRKQSEQSWRKRNG